MIAFVSQSEPDCRTLREVAGLASQSVVSCTNVQQARRAIRLHAPNEVWENGMRSYRKQKGTEQALECTAASLFVPRNESHRSPPAK